MWLISAVVLFVFGFVLSNQPFPASVQDWLERTFPNDVAGSPKVIALSFLAGLLIAGSPIHLFGKYLPTVVHELGHSFMMGILGLRPTKIVLSRDTSGYAAFDQSEKVGKLRFLLVLVSGYPAPVVASVASVLAVGRGYSQAWFTFASAVLLVALVFLMSNFWGKVWTGIAVVGSYFGLTRLPIENLSMIVVGIAGYLALEGIRDSKIQLRIIKSGYGESTDAQRIGAILGIKPVTSGRLHRLLVVAIGAGAAYLAVHPYWSEIRKWVEDQIHSRI
jgi:hypothetical protein